MTATDHDASFCCGAGEGFVQAAHDLIVDHPMWIDGEGQGLDYLPERESRIGDFLEALLPLVRSYGDNRAAAAIAAMPPSPAEEAVKRVEALAEEWESLSVKHYARLADRIRAALASPAPAPQEPACQWAHGPVTDLDSRGLCPVCAEDEL